MKNTIIALLLGTLFALVAQCAKNHYKASQAEKASIENVVKE